MTYPLAALSALLFFAFPTMADAQEPLRLERLNRCGDLLDRQHAEWCLSVRGLTNAPLQVIALGNSYHVATMDNDAPRIFQGTAEFIRSVVEGPSQGTPSASQKETADD